MLHRAWLMLAAASFVFAAGVARAADSVSVAALAFVSSAPVFIAKDKGYFAAEGLDVDIKFFEAAQPVAVAVASGDADFGITGLTAGFYNLAAKGALKIIASQSREEPGYDFVAYVVSRKAWDEGFRSVADYPGKVVGITQVGSTFHYNIGKLAEKRGFALDRIVLKPLQSIPNVVAALQGSQIDSALLPTNIALGLQAQGAGRIIGFVHQETPWQLGALFTSTRNVTARRDMVQRLVRAYQRGTADYAEAFHQRDAAGRRVFGPQAEALVPIIARYVRPAPTPEQVKASVSFIDPAGRLKVQDIHDQVAWYKRMGMVDADADAGDMLDLGFVAGHLDLPKS